MKFYLINVCVLLIKASDNEINHNLRWNSVISKLVHLSKIKW